MDQEYIETQTNLSGEWKTVKVICPYCTSDGFVYIYENEETCYCLQCDEEFDLSEILENPDLKINWADSTEDRDIQSRLEEMCSDDPEVVKELADRIIDGQNLKSLRGVKQLPAYQHKSWESGSSRSGSGSRFDNSFDNGKFSTCVHTPQHIIDGKTWGVWAGKKEDCRRFAKDFDVIMNLTFLTIKEPHVIPIPELAEFAEVDCQFKEIQLDWPDFGTINMPREFWEKLITYLETNNLRLLVFCTGGHGRTGTALAVMMGLALGYKADQAINWLHQYYCASAIETMSQENYVRSILREEIPTGTKFKGPEKDLTNQINLS